MESWVTIDRIWPWNNLLFRKVSGNSTLSETPEKYSKINCKEMMGFLSNLLGFSAVINPDFHDLNRTLILSYPIIQGSSHLNFF